MFFGRNEFKLLSDTNDMQERHFLFKFCDKYLFKVEEGRNGGHVQTQKSHFCEKSETHRSFSLSFLVHQNTLFNVDPLLKVHQVHRKKGRNDGNLSRQNF